MKKLLFILIGSLFFSGCITLGGEEGFGFIGKTEDPQVTRFTTEKIQKDASGTVFILVAFPKDSIGHDFIKDDNNEMVAIAVLPSSNE